MCESWHWFFTKLMSPLKLFSMSLIWNIYCDNLIMSLNISDFNLFFKWKLQPPAPWNPPLLPLSQQPLLKAEVLSTLFLIAFHYLSRSFCPFILTSISFQDLARPPHVFPFFTRNWNSIEIPLKGVPEKRLCLHQTGKFFLEISAYISTWRMILEHVYLHWF